MLAIASQFILKLSRKNKKSLMLIFDFIVIILSIFLAYFIRMGFWYSPTGDNDLLLVMLAPPLLALPIFIRFGIYRDVVRFVGFKELWNIIQAVSLYSILWGLIADDALDSIPRSVAIINWLLVIIIISFSRLFVRWMLLEASANNNILIYGAGSAGRQLTGALNESKEYKPVGFIDDSTEIYRHSIRGIKVYSPDDLEGLIKKKNIKEVVLAMPSISRIRRNEIIHSLGHYPVIVRSLPGLSDFAKGKVKINDLLEIDVRDLLGRESVNTNKNLLEVNISNKVVLVTGAGGSIGSELCRQIIYLKPNKLVLFEISESSLYQINQELISIGVSDVEIFTIIGSVSDKKRMKQIFNYYGVQTVYHAAAYKHVPLVEYNQSQGVLNNSIGTLRLAEAAISENVETFVLISTDKAVRPTSVMGASKRVAELVLQAFNTQSQNTCFTMVRFGNVLDSSGSVIPLFKKQIQTGGPVTVTHSDMVRYFMTIPEAVELVVQAGALAKGGEVFVLDMGKPIRINDLAEKMIKLSGLQLIDKDNPDGDIEIQYTGLRPGEKLFEELLVDGKFSLTENKLIMRAEEAMISWVKLEPILIEIEKAAINNDNEKIYELLKDLVPGFHSKN